MHIIIMSSVCMSHICVTYFRRVATHGYIQELEYEAIDHYGNTLWGALIKTQSSCCGW